MVDGMVTDPFGLIDSALLRYARGLAKFNAEPSSGTMDVGSPINLHITTGDGSG